MLLDSEETQEAPPDPEEKTREAPSDSEEETKDVAGLAAGSIDLEGSAIHARRKLTISAGVEGAAPQSFLSMIEQADGEGDEESASMCDGGGSVMLQRKGETPELIAKDMSPEQYAGSRR